MVKNKIQVKKGIGMLGTQNLISSPNKKYILTGERSLSQSYFPGALTVPGGMLEFNDLNIPQKKLLHVRCMRKFVYHLEQKYILMQFWVDGTEYL